MASELKPVYLITGGDRPKIQRALRRLRDRIGDDATELLSAHDASGEDAVAACNSLGLVAAELKKDSALAKACAKAGEVLVYDVAKRRLSEWVAKQFSDRGVRVD